MRRLALLLGLLVVAGLVLWTLRDGRSPGAAGAVRHDAAPEASAPPRLEGRVAEAEIGTPASSRVAAPDGAEASGRRVTVDLHVRIADLHVLVEVRAWCPTSIVESVLSPGVEVTREGPGALRLDVTELVRWIQDRRRRPEIQLEPWAQGHVGSRVLVALPAPDALLAGDATIDPVEVVFEPAALVDGRIVGPEGLPVAGAGVALHLLTPDGPEPEAVADGTTDEEGRFSLASGRPGRHLLVASWLDLDPRGRLTARPLPASTVVDLVVGETREAGVLRLRSSHAIRGRVRVEGGSGAQATIGWRLAGGARPLRRRGDSRFDDDTMLWWWDGAVHWAGDSVQADERGRFEIRGASAVPYRLHVDELPGAHLHRMSKEPAEVEVTPPADDVTLAIRLAHLVLEVRADGAPLALEEAVRVSDLGMHPDLPEDVCWGVYSHRTDADGRLEIGLTPGHRYAAHVQRPGFETWARPFEAPPAGETLTLRVDLEREGPKPRLVVVLAGEGADGIALATFGFYEPDVDPGTRTPWPVRTVTPVDGRFVVEDLVPGRTVMHVHPGRGWDDLPGDWLESVVEVELPETGEVAVRVPVRRGGRLLLEVTDVDGRYLECPCTLRGPDGRPVETSFVARMELGGLVISDELPGIGPAWVERVLEPGTYEVVLEPGGAYAREVRTVEVRAGAPAALRVTLRAR